MNNRLMHTFIINTTFFNTVSLWHVSAIIESSSGSTTDTFQQQGQQNELPDVKVSLAASNTLYYAAARSVMYLVAVTLSL